MRVFFFFFNDTATTEIYTLSLHDALPICSLRCAAHRRGRAAPGEDRGNGDGRREDARGDAAALPQRAGAARRAPRHRQQLTRPARFAVRSEEHTSELQSQSNLVCRLLLEKKKKKHTQKSK